MKTAEHPGLETVSALHVPPNAASRAVEDALVAEGPLQIRVNGSPWSVTMRTPGDDALLALGLLFTEGVLRDRGDLIRWTEKISSLEGVADRVDLEMRPAALAGINLANRRLDSNSSCGVCGKIDAGDLDMPGGACGSAGDESAGPGRLDLALLPGLEGKMRAAQTLFGLTGGCHGAAIFDLEGNLLILKEDIGRHNAVDKAIGHLWREGSLDKAAVLFISGRVSYEIVAKASRAGIGFLLAVSAPSALAVKLCREAGITLLAFCRSGKATVYTHAERVVVGSAMAGSTGAAPGDQASMVKSAGERP